MRAETGIIWDVWSTGGPFIGETRPVGRVTVEADYRLERGYAGDPNKQPVRWFQRLFPPPPLYNEDVVSVAYDDSWWGSAVQLEQGQGSANGPRPGAPASWPDPLAWWVWSTMGSTVRDPVDSGTSYFRQTFSVGGTTTATIYATADNVFDLYLDGVQVLSSGASQLYNGRPAWQYTFQVTVSLSAGDHLIAIRGRNVPQYHEYEAVGSPNPAGLIAAVIAEGGSVLVRTNNTWASVGNLQVESEIPNVRSINIDRSLDTDAATCEITLSNQWMRTNEGRLIPPSGVAIINEEDPHPLILGEPGFFSPSHGATAEARARWQQSQSNWGDLLVPNALIRTYQGFGGASPMSIPEATEAGYLAATGVWLVDEVRVDTKGDMSLRCRDMAKLLIEQQLYPPLVPTSSYPLRYCRWDYKNETRQKVTEAVVSAGDRTLTFDTSANYAWYSSGGVHGHHPSHAFDSNAESFYLSVGNSGPTEPYAVEWVQATCGEVIDAVWVSPWAGNYTCYVSVMVNGSWVDVIGTIPYSEAGVGRYNGVYEARIPAVAKAGVPWEAPVSIKLPSAYRAEKVRFTFTNLAHSQWGPYPYRAGARELRASLSGNEIKRDVQTVTELVRRDGNYKDFSDIVRDLLLWSGWWLRSDPPYTDPLDILGNIESTGSYSEDCFPDDAFDKRPVIDAINQVKEVVGYIFWIDEDGGARFESPNWWEPGNFLTTGEHTDTIPEIDERLQLTNYAVSFSDATSRSEIILGTADPYKGIPGALVTRFTPPTAVTLKGMVKPAFFPQPVQVTKAEQETMGELIAMHIWFRQRLGNVTAVANPMIQINDQVRVFERITGDTYVHYVRGMNTSYEAESGTYTMTLTTHWMGDGEDWALQ
jgi:hypothetical protein